MNYLCRYDKLPVTGFERLQFVIGESCGLQDIDGFGDFSYLVEYYSLLFKPGGIMLIRL